MAEVAISVLAIVAASLALISCFLIMHTKRKINTNAEYVENEATSASVIWLALGIMLLIACFRI